MGDDHGALRALDTAFLYAETPVTPMHVGSLSTYRPGPWFDDRGRVRLEQLRAHIAAKAADVPRLRQRPSWPPAHAGRPHWVDDPGFDIRRHVRTLHLPEGSGEDELLRAASTAFGTPIDVGHPLWEMWFVDGLRDGRMALIEKLHHALVDGIGGVDVAMMLLDLTPDEPAPNGVHTPPPEGRSPLAMLVDAAGNAVREPWAIGRTAASAATHPVRTLRTGRQLAGAFRSVVGELIAPRSSLYGAIGMDRTYRVVRRSLPQVRATAKALGGTVNEVVLAAVTAGLHDLFDARDEDLRGAPLHALVPVSVRSGDEHNDLGNRVAAMLVPLPVTETGDRQRFDEVARAARYARRHHQPELSAAVLAAADHWPEAVVATIGRLVHHQPSITIVVTNVPGPPIPLYLGGAELLEMFPLCPLARNTPFSVAILSYCDQLTLGLWADDVLVPDLGVLLAGIERGFDALDALAGPRPPAPRARARRAPAGASRASRTPAGEGPARDGSARSSPTARTPAGRGGRAAGGR